MNIKTKKIFAKEFIFLVSIIGAGLITFLLIFLYNYYYEIQGDKKTELIWKNYSIAAELKETFKSKIEKQEWYFKKSSEYFNLDNYNSTRSEEHTSELQSRENL